MIRILVIDDSATFRNYQRQILEQAGFAVEEAVNGQQALELLSQQHFQLLLVDLNMPTMDGLTFLRRLRADQNLSQVPAVVISTSIHPDEQQQYLSAGANYYLVKPVQPDQLTMLACLFTGQSYERTA